MSNNYAIQCLAIALLGDSYDAEGYKETVPCSCLPTFHMHAVYGHHFEALECFCNILEIRYIKYNT